MIPAAKRASVAPRVRRGCRSPINARRRRCMSLAAAAAAAAAVGAGWTDSSDADGSAIRNDISDDLCCGQMHDSRLPATL